MIRGAFILAVGLTLGYAKGLHENEAVLDKVEDMVKRFNAFLEDSEQKAREKAAEEKKQADIEAVQRAEEPPAVKNRFTTDTDDTDNTENREGETPS